MLTFKHLKEYTNISDMMVGIITLQIHSGDQSVHACIETHQVTTKMESTKCRQLCLRLVLFPVIILVSLNVYNVSFVDLVFKGGDGIRNKRNMTSMMAFFSEFLLVH